jgi:hypothetical protein
MAKSSSKRSSKDKYFAAMESEELADMLLTKDNHFYNSILSSGYVEKIRKLFAMYHGMSYYDTNGGHEITFEGEQGELTSISVNHIRNIGQHMLNLVTASRPTMEVRAINSDSKSKIQTKLAGGLLDYYMREKNLEDVIHRATEYSICLGSGFVRLEWDATSGDPIKDAEGESIFDEETQTYVYEGDANFKVFSPFDVTFDTTKEDQNHDWYRVRNWKNKFDLIAKYPELEDKILGMKTKSELEPIHSYIFGEEETSDIAVYEFYHRRTESMPDGRYMIFLDSDIVLVDQALPYDDIPIYRIAPSDILGTPLGYTPLFDLMPLQDAANMLYSTILTNQQAFGVQNIYVPRGADISMESLSGGLNIIEGNQNAGKPEPINLTSTPKEIFEYLQLLIQTMETISGINSVVRGNPEANLRSGSALALVQANSIQFMSGLANQYNKLIENVGTGLLRTLQKYADTKRVAAIAGEANRSELKEFTKEDLTNINRVIVSAGNPLAKTVGGRLQMATELLQYQLLSDPTQYFQIIENGSFESITEAPNKELNLITSENEKMLDGQMPISWAYDKHSQHILHHRSLLGDSSVRENPELAQIVMQHIEEHMNFLMTIPPEKLAVIGEQAILPPVPMDQNGNPLPPPTDGPANLSAPAGASDPSELPSELPEPASPPGEFEGAPTSGVELQDKLRQG